MDFGFKEEKRDVWKLFNKIAPYYDFINRILSFGIDRLWRKRIARFVRNGDSVLDIATGTGDVVSSILKERQVNLVIGVDRAENMLSKARKKIKDRRTIFLMADGMRLPFKDRSFDAVTISFGIRNMTDPMLCLSECYRVLKEKGRIIILEFSLPEDHVVRFIYLFYLRRILPFIGRLLSGDRHAYSYLNRTIEVFPYGDSFLDMLKKIGFKKTSYFSQTFGVCMIYVGEKWI